MSLVEEELGGPTVFRDLSKLDFDYVPDSLPGREDEIRGLTSIYRSLTQGAAREHALITGPVGTGKTAIAKSFGRDLQRFLKTRQGKSLDVVHVNCRKHKSAGLTLLQVMGHFDPHYPERGFSTGEMLRDLRRFLERRQSHLLVILDEVDALLRTDGSNLVYDLTRFNDETGPSWQGISLILVSQENILGLLDPAALSTFKQTNVLTVQPYDARRLERIVLQRVELAFQPGTVDGDTACLVADIAAQEGNARLAIEILQKAGQLADDEGTPAVGPDHVRAAKADSYSFITASKLMQMQKHPLLVLLALARRLRRDQSAYATTGNVESSYATVCEEHAEEPRAHTQFWKYLKQLQDAGLILSRLSGKGQAGTTQILSIPDAPAPVVERKVLEILQAQAKAAAR